MRRSSNILLYRVIARLQLLETLPLLLPNLYTQSILLDIKIGSFAQTTCDKSDIISTISNCNILSNFYLIFLSQNLLIKNTQKSFFCLKQYIGFVENYWSTFSCKAGCSILPQKGSYYLVTTNSQYNFTKHPNICFAWTGNLSFIIKCLICKMSWAYQTLFM